MKKLLYTLVILGLLTATALGAVSWWVMQKMGPEIWIEQAEKNWNCRAQIDDAQLSLFTRPATLKFTGVRLAPRDLEVAKPYAERTPLPEVSALVEIPEITLEVKLDDLLNRRLFIEQLRIVRPSVRELQDEKGKSSLEALFKKPGSLEAATATPEASTQPAPVETKAAENSSPSFSYAIQSASIEKGTFDITNGTTKVLIQDFDFNVSDIDVNLSDLVNHNHMKASLNAVIDVSGMARIDGAKRPAELAHLVLSGQGDIAPLSPATGEWNPVSNLTLSLAKGSVLAGHMTIGDAAGKDLRKLQEYGVDLAPVVIGGPLQEDAVVTGTYARDRFLTRTLTRFVFPEYEVAIEPKSWINGPQDKHEIEFRLSCGPDLQSRLVAGISNAKLGDSIARAVTKALSDEQGRMTFDIESEGSLSSPKVKPKTDRVLKNLMRGEGLGDLLQGLLKKL